ncbi:Protein FAM186A [Mus musculus] [Rhizoctonia solani]|uniref:Protein FAM186A [Mus musculus] n=1 Tax=Rhizoctonia solani TaxID=456999 RepID=A0A0K6G9R6_9AGAM|nr:Protein FAM186A [Mus musculus] [Rhizoctonia solani]
MPNTMPDLSGSASSEHVASGSFAPDANALREAALKSRRKKQAIAREQLEIVSSPPATGMYYAFRWLEFVTYSLLSAVNSQPLVDQDTPMNDASSLVDTPTTDISKSREEHVDTEDGEISESTTGDRPDTPEREKTPRPPSTADALNTPDSNAAELPKYVRPGLNMTARDLDEAKHLILDLLGLGVTPEYLVDCGVSPQCLAVCFYELNLRFPLNLDRRQINLPSFYDLDKHMKDSQRREQIIRQRDRGRLPPKPIPAIMTAEGSESLRVDQSTSPRRKGSKETLVSIESSPPTQVDANTGQGATTEITGPHLTEVVQPSSPKEVDISLIEDQKRMELLARKAAMDSITKKRAAKNFGPALSSPEQSAPQFHHLEIKDVESAVDALLASVRMNSDPSNEPEDKSSKECEVESMNSGERLPDYDSDAMVEDELETQSPSCSDSDVDELMDTPDSEPNATPEPILTNTPALLSSPKPYLSRVQFDTPDPVRSSSLPTQPTPIVVPVVARRSRPIASDFIDQTPPRPASASKAGTERTALLKRKRSFVDPTIWPKRLVIDLDSSDEEDDQDEGVSSGAAGSSGSSSKDRAPSRTSSRDKPTANGQDQAAQMLLEKELQIKAMMQKIKMRELQKKKSASGSRTPMPAPGTPAEPSKTAILNADPTSSPITSTVNLTPVATPSSEIPPTIPMTEQEATPIPVAKENHSILNNSLGIVSPKMDKGKGKALEPEGIPQDDLTLTSAVAHSNNDTRSEPSLNLDSEQTPTHFKAYVSPLAGFTSPNLQRARPTDQQLSAILWISSSAGQTMDRQLCMYEFPSGICKNQGCKDIHTRDFGASDDDIRRTARTMFPNARPESLTEIIARVRQSIQAN